MIPNDPVNLLDPLPFGPLSYYGHVIIGVISLVAALLALCARKGSGNHILAGRIFIGSIAIVSLTSLVMQTIRLSPPLLVAAITSLYAVATAYLALQPATKAVKRSEYGLFAIELLMLLVFAAMASVNILAGTINPIGPIVIAVIPVILLVGDINFFRKADMRARFRIRRHLARMIWAVIIAVRAPLAEVYQELFLPVWVILFVPLVIAPVMIGLFLKKQPNI